MKIGNPKLLIDLYEWLPSDGESSVSFRSAGRDIVIDVLYEKEIPGSSEEDLVLSFKREILFKSVTSFLRTPFPGWSLFEYDADSEKSKPGALTEYLLTDFAKNSIAMHQDLYGGRSMERHFSVQFLSVNVAFHVLAEDVLVSSEQSVG